LAARRLWAIGLATAAIAWASAPSARPVSVEDMLQHEEFGAVRLAAGERWLVVEQRGPYASGSRFDYFQYNKLFRTQLRIADLAHPGPLLPLLRQEAGAGYALGPTSPDGARVVIYRLRRDRLQLGVVTLATRAVRWLPVTPEITQVTRTVQWRGSTDLIAIARAAGDQPYELRWSRPEAPLPARWAATAKGLVSVTAVGSGRFIAERPQAAPRRLVQVSAVTGRSRTLATGAFTDLELSASSRRLAAIEAGDDIPLRADQPVQGDYGVAVQRMRLAVLDLRNGTLSHPCPGCDVLSNLLSWSPDRDELLLYARTDGAPWTAGRLVRIDGATGAARDVATAVKPSVERRPEVVFAGWWGQDPIVFGRSTGAARSDWYRLGPAGDARLTKSLAAPPREGLVITPEALLVAADGAVWRIGPDGASRRLSAAPFAAIPRRSEGVPGRPAFSPRHATTLAGVLHGQDGDRAVAMNAEGGTSGGLPLRAGASVLAVATGRGGLVTEQVSGGGQSDLDWTGPGGRPLHLAQINRRMAVVDLPSVVPVAHTGPNGEPLRSWLLLPRQAPGRAPPLIVVPYLGTVYASSPLNRLLADGPVPPEAALVGHGYAVLMPSLPAVRGGAGPGVGLADRLLQIVTAATRQSNLKGAFDPERLALWGHSFGGYNVLSVVTETNRFKAAIALAAPSDLLSLHGTFDPGHRAFPDTGLATPWQTGWVESLQGEMQRPPWDDLERYARNTPVLHADRITTPLMLVHGDQDMFAIGQAEQMFSSLYRQDKDAVLVTYWGEKHIYASPGNLRDLYARTFSWFDRHLQFAPISGGGLGSPAGRARGSASVAPRTPAPPI
jgi:dipeptidyl aminopeptidase/acylaminoacyl peptidase